jgi:hypothetical protein
VSRSRRSCYQGYLPVVVTRWQCRFGCTVEARAFATAVIGYKAAALARFAVTASGLVPPGLMFGIAISPAGPTGFKRHDRAGRYFYDRRLTFMQYLPNEARLVINSSNGPLFDIPPAAFGTYGNGDSYDPDFYLAQNPYRHLETIGVLNGWEIAVDNIAGMCCGAFLWPLALSAANP